MSAISELPAGSGVLQYTASRPAVLLSPHPSDEELAFDWTLSERDIAFILTNHRGPELDFIQLRSIAERFSEAFQQ